MDIFRASIYRAGYPLALLYWAISKPKIDAATCIIENEGSYLLVRHTYGRRAVWRSPGGALKQGEDPCDAATREVREEVGLELEGIRSIGHKRMQSSNRNVILHIFYGTSSTRDLKLDRGEIKEAKWFSADKLPENIDSSFDLTRI